MTSKRLELPRLVAGRDYANDMVDANLSDEAGGLAGIAVTVDASRLTSGTSSFAAQLVERVLIDGDAKVLVLTDAPANFTSYIVDAARALKVTDRVDVASSASVHVAAS